MDQRQHLGIPTADGLMLDIVKYSGGGGVPVICIPGLTRNAADFEDIAPIIAGTGRDVFAVSLRGRGRSQRDPNYLNYHPLTYRDDVVGVLDALGIGAAIFIGTSLGGIVTMLIAQRAPHRVIGAVLNDVGPEFAPEGIARIAGYVGGRSTNGDAPALGFDEAVSVIRAINEVAFPGKDAAFWQSFARRTFREHADGAWLLDYDPGIGKALLEVGPAPDLWPAFKGLRDIPTMILRGAISDLLSPAIIAQMQAERPGFDYVEVPAVGHAPTLSEPEAVEAITRFVGRVG